jgi:benzodiazapine receptor
MSKTRQFSALALFLISTLAAGALGGWATSSSVASWYPGLSKPAWNPPAWVFGPVWTALYISIGVAAWLVWRRREAGAVRGPMTAWAVQLALNAGWSVVFFGLRQPGWAVVEITALWCAIAVTICLFAQHSRAAALLLVPYLAWVSFATVLNVAIWRLN